ncbi:phosphatidylinositol transfer protein csr1 [Paecilomyces lecythidis]|uniref:Phosphatidylinositol transfer protein csr1 n=1 Tax=Paecilomyces lecythidis TaxID=3004212 RepID=A0ABR3XNX3_9EURO
MGSISHPSGHVDNLTTWQEAKLVEVWRLALQAFGMYNDIPKNEVARVRKFWTLGMQKINIKIEDATSQDKAMVRKFVSEGLKSIKIPPDETEIIMNRVELLLFEEEPISATTNGVLAERDKSALPPAVRKVIDGYKPADLMELFWSTLRKDNPDALVLRFLRARKWDVDKAIEMMINVGWWRVGEMRVDDITRSGEAGALADLSSQDVKVRKEASDFIDQLRLGKAYLHGVDKQERPVCYIRVRLHKIGEHTRSSLEKLTVHLIETVRLTMVHPVETAVIVFDMTGFGLTNMDYLHVKFIIQCFELNYPESLGAILVHKAPWIFSSIWPMIKGWLDPIVAEKVHFTKNVHDLEAFIRRDRIPKELSGDDDWKYHYIEPRPDENRLMKDTVTRDSLMEKRTGLFNEFRQNVYQWVTAAENGNDTTEIKNKRKEIIEKVENSYWELDPYIRAKSQIDREGLI